jgi:aryl-alcohol dehydrogenase-like predicted oxidoreductase
MKFKTLPGTDIKVSDLCLGTMTWGSKNTEAEAHAQLDCAVAHGVNFIDTAEGYPAPGKAETQGRTETYLGTWLKHQPRDRFIIATKVTGPGVPYLVRAGDTNLCRANVERAVEDSLRRLQTDYIDLYQIHYPDRYVPPFGGPGFDPKHERPTLPIAEQVETMAALVRAGKIRHWGIGNETAWGAVAFVRAADALNAPRPVTIQNGYNLVERNFEVALSEVCHREIMGLLAYSPLAGGVLTGKYAGGVRPEGARFTGDTGFVKRWIRPAPATAAEAYTALARKRGLDPAHMALAFVRQRWFVASAIFGATRLEMLEANLRAADVTLDAETLAEIDAIHAGR